MDVARGQAKHTSEIRHIYYWIKRIKNCPSRQLKYEQDLEFYATARQLRWKQLKHERKSSLKRLKNEKFQHRVRAQSSLLGVRLENDVFFELISSFMFRS